MIWDFLCDGKVNQSENNVCCVDIENGDMSMVNLDSYIDSRRIQFLYRIVNEPIDSCNALGKYWLSRLDLKFNDLSFFKFHKSTETRQMIHNVFQHDRQGQLYRRIRY